jgi:hypothetical protein
MVTPEIKNCESPYLEFKSDESNPKNKTAGDTSI